MKNGSECLSKFQHKPYKNVMFYSVTEFLRFYQSLLQSKVIRSRDLEVYSTLKFSNILSSDVLSNVWHRTPDFD